MALSRIEQWLSKQEPALKGWLLKSCLAVFGIIGPVVLALSPLPTLLKLVSSAAWLLLLFCLWLLARLVVSKAKAESLKSENESLRRGRGDTLSQIEFSILSYAHSSYPTQRTRDEIKRALNLSDIDLDFALQSLVSPVRGFMHPPVGGLWYDGHPNPNSYSITQKGVEAIKRTHA